MSTTFELNTISCQDTQVLIQQLGDSTIDLIIADIPYFGIVDDDWDNQWESLDAYLAWLDALFGQFARVLKQDRACYVYSSITYYPHVQLCLNKHLTYSSTITWKKQRSRANGWGFNREEICVNVKGHHDFKEVLTSTLMLPHLRKGSTDYSNGKRRIRTRDHKRACSIWDDVAQVCSFREQLHTAEKPVELARRMIEASSGPGDIVLVPFVGSGSECEACIRMDRSFIGFEMSQHYCDIAKKRIRDLNISAAPEWVNWT